jgi:hypothetical protein
LGVLPKKIIWLDASIFKEIVRPYQEMRQEVKKIADCTGQITNQHSTRRRVGVVAPSFDIYKIALCLNTEVTIDSNHDKLDSFIDKFSLNITFILIVLITYICL